jgi:hypothetical protein
LNLYQYVSNNPLSTSDPLGLWYVTFDAGPSGNIHGGVGGGASAGGGVICGTNRCGEFDCKFYVQGTGTFGSGLGGGAGASGNVNFSPFGTLEDFEGPSKGVVWGVNAVGASGSIGFSTPESSSNPRTPIAINISFGGGTPTPGIYADGTYSRAIYPRALRYNPPPPPYVDYPGRPEGPPPRTYEPVPPGDPFKHFSDEPPYQSPYHAY